MMLDVQVVDELFEISQSLCEVETRIRAGALTRRDLLRTAEATKPLIDRLQEVAEQQGCCASAPSVQMVLARARIQSAQSHGVWVADHGQWASEGAIRRQLLWTAIAGQTAVELLTAPRHPGDIARA